LELLADFAGDGLVGLALGRRTESRSATFKSQAAAPQPFGLLVLAVLQNCIGAEAFARFQGAEKLYPFYFESVTRAA
jgi:hypothetical protein